MRDELRETIASFNSSANDYESTIAPLDNYNETYDYFFGKLTNKDKVLDLACGPANISKRLMVYLQSVQITGVDMSEEMIRIAKRNVPSGNFIVENIINYKSEKCFDAIILSFALPFLNKQEIKELFSNFTFNLNKGGTLYISFMAGVKEGYETPSFNKSVQIYFYYHNKRDIVAMLSKCQVKVLKEWELDYIEANGDITKDIVIVARKE